MKISELLTIGLGIFFGFFLVTSFFVFLFGNTPFIEKNIAIVLVGLFLGTVVSPLLAYIN